MGGAVVLGSCAVLKLRYIKIRVVGGRRERAAVKHAGNNCLCGVTRRASKHDLLTLAKRAPAAIVAPHLCRPVDPGCADLADLDAQLTGGVVHLEDGADHRLII